MLEHSLYVQKLMIWHIERKLKGDKAVQGNTTTQYTQFSNCILAHCIQINTHSMNRMEL